MNIVIVGASDIGLHLANLFSQKNDRVILVDKSPQKIDLISREMDIATRLGQGTDWEILEELLEYKPDIIIALTHDDETNLVICNIAKELGYPQTIARVKKTKYLLQSRINFEQLFCADYLINPELLTAEAIASVLLSSQATAVESFCNGKVQLRTYTIPSTWNKAHICLSQKEHLQLPDNIILGLIKRTVPIKNGRDKEIYIYPHGQDSLLPGDEVTVAGTYQSINEIHKTFGMPSKQPSRILILGGSSMAIHLAKILQRDKISLTILERDFDKCTKLAESLPFATILHRDATDLKFLQSLGIKHFDAAIACTGRDDVNFLAGSIAKELGVQTVICSITDTSYLPLFERAGITFTASSRLRASNRILSMAHEASQLSMASLYNNQVQVIELQVSEKSEIAGIPIKFLSPEFPEQLLILTILSRGRLMIAEGSRVLTPGDRVVVITTPQNASEIKRLF